MSMTNAHNPAANPGMTGKIDDHGFAVVAEPGHLPWELVVLY